MGCIVHHMLHQAEQIHAKISPKPKVKLRNLPETIDLNYGL